MHKTLNADVSGAFLSIAVFAVETECLIDVDRRSLKSSRSRNHAQGGAIMKTFNDELADVFAMLHPAALPMLKRMFEDFRRDAKDDGELALVTRADKAIAAVTLVIDEQTALESRA
jgi:hypothetical protein